MVSFKTDGDVMTIKEFIDAVGCGAFTDDDGFGHYASDSLETKEVIDLSDIKRYTYSFVVWYNK